VEKAAKSVLSLDPFPAEEGLAGFTELVFPSAGAMAKAVPHFGQFNFRPRVTT
jgi:hypothetical protein